MDSKLLLIQAAAKKVADTTHPLSTFIDAGIDKKLETFKDGMKEKDPHLFMRNYITQGSKIFGTDIKIGKNKAKPIAVMKNIYGLPLSSLISRMTTNVEHGWTRGKQLHYQSFEEGPLAAFVTLVREMWQLKSAFLKKGLIKLTPEENKKYDAIFNSNYLSLIADLINKSKSDTQEGIIKEITTKGFDPRSDFMCEMLYSKFRFSGPSYVNLINNIQKLNSVSKKLYATSASISNAIKKLD